MGPLGVFLSATALATMWGTFAWSKSKAASLRADGSYELLNGGSHASGNDISIGLTPDGKQRRAEGGEGLAVFNKRAVKKYGSSIKYMVNGINSLGFFKYRQ